MRLRTLPGTSIKVSPVSLGTMIFGEQLNERESWDLLDVATQELGINMIDTAELYPVPCRADTAGRTDEIIGAWLRGRPELRSKLVLTTKIIAYSQSFSWFRGGPRPTQEQFQQSLDDSLRRLGVDYVDLLLIHWPARNTVNFGSLHFDPQKERQDLREWDFGCNFDQQAQFMDTALRAGKIRSWGLSNETTYGLMKFLEVCRRRNLPHPSVIQNAYSLLNRTFESELWEACMRENVGLLPYSSLAMGHLSGKYLKQARKLEREEYRLKLYPALSGRYARPQVEAAVEAYQHLARNSGLDLVTLALAFVHRRPFVTSNVIGVRNVQQLRSNLKALDCELSDEIMAQIQKIHSMIPNPAP